jgi:hypothetical protein
MAHKGRANLSHAKSTAKNNLTWNAVQDTQAAQEGCRDCLANGTSNRGDLLTGSWPGDVVRASQLGRD